MVEGLLSGTYPGDTPTKTGGPQGFDVYPSRVSTDLPARRTECRRITCRSMGIPIPLKGICGEHVDQPSRRPPGRASGTGLAVAERRPSDPALPDRLRDRRGARHGARDRPRLGQHRLDRGLDRARLPLRLHTDDQAACSEQASRLRRASALAVASDTVSITTMETVDNAFILIVPGALAAGLADGLFWWSLALSLVIAFVLTVPVNRWLIAPRPRPRRHARTTRALTHSTPRVRQRTSRRRRRHRSRTAHGRASARSAGSSSRGSWRRLVAQVATRSAPSV